MAYPRQTSNSPLSETKEMQPFLECLGSCIACAKKCIEEGNSRLAMTCHDCAEICDLALKMKCSDSEFSQQVCNLCSQICKTCATACDRAPSQQYQECAEACRRCADACSS